MIDSPEDEYKGSALGKIMEFFEQISSFFVETISKATPVEVEMLKTNWIFRGTNGTNGITAKEKSDISDLLSIFNDEISESIYQTRFVSHLIHEIWTIHQYNIIFIVFIPFLIYFSTVLYFFSTHLNALETGGESLISLAARVPIYLGCIYF